MLFQPAQALASVTDTVHDCWESLPAQVNPARGEEKRVHDRSREAGVVLSFADILRVFHTQGSWCQFWEAQMKEFAVVKCK